jgi:hypothetical protein
MVHILVTAIVLVVTAVDARTESLSIESQGQQAGQ